MPSPAPVALPGHEQRRSVRYPCGPQTMGHLVIGIEEAVCPAGVRNISAGGISLVVERRIEPETMMTVRLFNAARNFFTRLPARVVYAIDCPDGSALLGAVFTRELSAEELSGLL